MLYASIARGIEAYHCLALEGWVAPLTPRRRELLDYLRRRRQRVTIH